METQSGTQLGTRIRSYRKQQRMTQASLAAKVGISTAYMNLIENNKRNVAGKLLTDFAIALGIERKQLTRGVTTEMIERLQQTARRYAHSYKDDQAELAQIEGFISRYPGWARLLDHQIQTHEDLERLSEQLSDRLAHDPILSETIHVMLSNITAIRSTSELLTLRGSMDEKQKVKFLQNIFLESKRLSATAEKLLIHFDPKANTGSSEGHHVSSLDITVNTDAPDDKIENRLSVEGFAFDDPDFEKTSKILTPDRIKESSASHGFNPFLIADYFDLPVRPVLYVLASLGGQQGMPRFGLLEIDNAAGVLYRQEIGDFRLPSRSGACPRWPIYRALSQPSQPLTMRMQLNSGQMLESFAIAEVKRRQYNQIAPVSRSTMIFHEPEPDINVECDAPIVNVGFHCSVCPRTECNDRRETYALKI